MSEEIRVKDLVKKQQAEIDELKKDVAMLATGLKRAAVEIESEWGEETLPEGTEIRGVKF